MSTQALPENGHPAERPPQRLTGRARKLGRMPIWGPLILALLVVGVGVAVWLFTHPPATGEDRIFEVAIQGCEEACNYNSMQLKKQPSQGEQGDKSADSKIRLWCRPGDLLRLSVTDGLTEGSGSREWVYRVKQGTSLRCRAVEHGLCVNDCVVGVNLRKDAGKEWLGKATAQERAALRVLRLDDKEAPDLELLKDLNWPELLVSIEGRSDKALALVAAKYPIHALMCKIDNWDSAGGSPGLKSLRWLFPVGNLPPAGALDNIETLFWGFLGERKTKSKAEDLAAVRGMTRLVNLHYPPVEEEGNANLAALAARPGLVSLSVFLKTGSDLSPLTQLPELRALCLFTDSPNLEPLRQLKKLRLLSLPSKEKTNLRPLENCKSLRVLLVSEKVAEEQKADLARLQQALPDTVIDTGAGICLGSGWVLLMLGLSILAGRWYRRRCQGGRAGA